MLKNEFNNTYNEEIQFKGQLNSAVHYHENCPHKIVHNRYTHVIHYHNVSFISPLLQYRTIFYNIIAQIIVATNVSCS